VAATKHRAGLRRLFALQVRDALKYLEKNIPDLQKMAVAYMPLGTLEELRGQIIDVALERAFLLDPLPTTESAFRQRLDEGRGRLTLIANEVARLALGILQEFAAATRKVKDSKAAADAVADIQPQLQRLCAIGAGCRPRYLKAIVLRLDKWRADPARDASRLAEIRPMEQKFWRLVAERKGTLDSRLQEFRWLLEELRVSLFAQELRTSQPVSTKRLDKAWAQLMQ
jgi:ATP-dependent helicase HrpA